MRTNFSRCPRYNVLEENDPAGFRSKACLQAKVEANVDTFEIPKHSPQLNLCDCWLWKVINTKMRETESAFADTKKETREQILRRLKRAAMNLDSDTIEEAVGNMRRRCQDLRKAKGGQIEG